MNIPKEKLKGRFKAHIATMNGEKVVIAKVADIDFKGRAFIVHRSYKVKTYTVSDVETGFILTYGKTEIEAIQLAKEWLKSRSKRWNEILNGAIRTLADYGIGFPVNEII